MLPNPEAVCLMSSSFFMKITKRSWRLPKGVPSDVNRFLSEGRVSSLKWLLKYVKRRLFCFVFVEVLGLIPEKNNISSRHKRILWINLVAPSLGDSLMDLSSRVLLVDREVILLTHPKNAPLYENKDKWFAAVYSSPRLLVEKIGINAFDLVICDSFSPRVLIKKLYVAPLVEFCGVYGYVNGFEVHRTYFAFARMMELLSLRHISELVQPTISVPEKLNKCNSVDVCVAVGGEWSFRTYDHWLPVVRWLVDRGLSVTLIGSVNGLEKANVITGSVSSVRSTVGELSLSEVVDQIASCKAFIGADGGLWHIACAIPVPNVVLFADCQIFDECGIRVTRETANMVTETLYDDSAVSNIYYESVIAAFERLCARIDL